MSSTLVTDEIRAKASQLYHGDDMCQEKSRFLLKEVGLPTGLLPLKDIEECGYVEETGFVWLKQKKKTEHKFAKINNKQVSYATEVTAYVEPTKIKKLTGVKTKELMVWATISDIYVDDPPTGKITFKSPTGLSRTFPVTAFEEEEDEKLKVKVVVDDKKDAVQVPAAAVTVPAAAPVAVPAAAAVPIPAAAVAAAPAQEVVKEV